MVYNRSKFSTIHYESSIAFLLSQSSIILTHLTAVVFVARSTGDSMFRRLRNILVSFIGMEKATGPEEGEKNVVDRGRRSFHAKNETIRWHR